MAYEKLAPERIYTGFRPVVDFSLGEVKPSSKKSTGSGIMWHKHATRRDFLRAGGIVSLAALTGCSALGQKEQRVEFEYQSRRVLGLIQVDGVVRNVGEAFVKEVQIQCDIYNAEDEVLETKHTRVYDIDVGAEKRFRIDFNLGLFQGVSVDRVDVNGEIIE